MEVNPQSANCSDNDLAGFLNRALAMQIYPVANSSEGNTDVGLVSEKHQSHSIIYTCIMQAPNNNK